MGSLAQRLPPAGTLCPLVQMYIKHLFGLFFFESVRTNKRLKQQVMTVFKLGYFVLPH